MEMLSTSKPSLTKITQQLLTRWVLTTRHYWEKDSGKPRLPRLKLWWQHWRQRSGEKSCLSCDKWISQGWNPSYKYQWREEESNHYLLFLWGNFQEFPKEGYCYWRWVVAGNGKGGGKDKNQPTNPYQMKSKDGESKVMTFLQWRIYLVWQMQTMDKQGLETHHWRPQP